MFTEYVTKDKKRKRRDDDGSSDKTKVFFCSFIICDFYTIFILLTIHICFQVLKRDYFDKIHVPRLPVAILSQLNDKPKKEFLEMKKSKLVSTTDFVIDKTKKRKYKPSNFLEESVYLNTDDNSVDKKWKAKIKKPKVLPFLPTACTSYSGFTTNFQVSVLPKKIEFVAQSNETSNFKKAYLEDNRVKKLRTYDLYKKRKNIKLTKY